MKARRLASILAPVLFTSVISHAQVLLGWDVSGIELDDGSYDSSFTLNSTTIGASVLGGALTLSSNVSRSTSVDQYGFKVSGGDAGVSATLATAIADGNYLQFTITAASGYELNLSSIEMNGTASGTGADNVAVLSSIDGFSDSAALATATDVAGTAGGFDTDPDGFGGSVTLSGIEYQGIDSVTFRIYGWNISSGTGVTYIRNLSGDDLEILGTVTAVPEPSSFAALLGLGALGLVATRRRRRQASPALTT